MGVDVDDGDRAAGAPEQRGGGDGRVVQVAGAAVERPRDVVAGRAAAGVGDRFAVGDEVDGRERDVDRGPRRLPGSGADRASSCRRRRARPRPDRGRHGGRASARQSRSREDVRHDAVGGESGRRPLVPRRAQELDERGVVHGEQRRSRRARPPRPRVRRPRPAPRGSRRRAPALLSPGVRTPTQTSASGSWRRQSSLQTKRHALGSHHVTAARGRHRHRVARAGAAQLDRRRRGHGRPRHGRARPA